MQQSQQQPSANTQQQSASGSNNVNVNNDVQTKIQSAIQQDATLSQNANVNVNVQNNQLVLTGTVPNEEAKRRAEQIAQSNASSSGLAVVDQITVANATTTPCPQGTTATVGSTSSTNAVSTETQGSTAAGMPQSDRDDQAKIKNKKHKKDHDKDHDKDNSNPR